MTLKTELLPHQRQAVDKLSGLRVGALYMEMGTGKTRTALELIHRRLAAGKIRRVIWLCPCSTKGNLLADVRKHSDLAELPGVLTVCGIETLSTSIRACSRLLAIAAESPTFLIVDESSLVKNPDALRSVHIQQLAERCPYRLILNGTPVTKYEADLYSQWRILDWRILGYRSFYSFSANHLEYDKDRPNRIVRALNVDYLTRKMEPYTYQCRKADVFRLPRKIYSDRFFSMTPEQDEAYAEAIDRLLTDLDDMSEAAVYRLLGALHAIVCGFAVTVGKGLHVTRRPMFPDPEDNPRISALLEEIDSAPEEDKVIVMCTWTQEISDIIQALDRRYPGQAVPFFGDVPQKRRQAVLDDFRDNRRFLVANRSCGAFGLNLQFCHRLVFYSNDWNWGTRAQAEDRIHRLGQDREVLITDIIARDSIDVQIQRCLTRKERLSDSFKSSMSRQSAANFLRGGPDNGKDLSEAKRARGRPGAP